MIKLFHKLCPNKVNSQFPVPLPLGHHITGKNKTFTLEAYGWTIINSLVEVETLTFYHTQWLEFLLQLPINCIQIYLQNNYCNITICGIHLITLIPSIHLREKSREEASCLLSQQYIKALISCAYLLKREILFTINILLKTLL